MENELDIATFEGEGGFDPTPVHEKMQRRSWEIEASKRREWFGNLSKDNADLFVARLKKLLAGKRYTFLSYNEAFGSRIEVRTNQALKGRSTKPWGRVTYPFGSADNIGLSIGADDSDDPKTRALLADHVHVMINDTYGVASLSTDTYFVFSPEMRNEPERVSLTFKAGAGNEITWVLYPTGDIQPGETY